MCFLIYQNIDLLYIISFFYIEKRTKDLPFKKIYYVHMKIEDNFHLNQPYEKILIWQKFAI